MAEYVDKALLAAEELSKYMTVMEVNTKEYGKQTVRSLSAQIRFMLTQYIKEHNNDGNI